MSTIVATPAKLCDAWTPPAVVEGSAKALVGATAAEARRGLLGWLVSGTLHAAAYGFIIAFGAESIATALPVQQGRASVALVSSMPASSRYVPEAAIEIVPEVPQYEPQLADPLQPRVTPPERTQTSDLPTPQAPPVEMTLAESEIVVKLPPRSDQPDQPPEPIRPPPSPERTAPTEAVAQPNPRADGLDNVDSLASIASLVSDGADVETLPSQFPANPAPPYPLDALQAGLEGRVMLRVVIGANGLAESVSIDATSGVPSLDESALSTVRRWRFMPGRRRGVAVRSVVRIPVRFAIRDV